jgi:hypothetical protein
MDYSRYQKKKKGMNSTLKMDELQKRLKNTWTFKTDLILNLVKYSKQAYYNGNPEYWFTYVTKQSFILGYAKNATKT